MDGKSFSRHGDSLANNLGAHRSQPMKRFLGARKESEHVEIVMNCHRWYMCFSRHGDSIASNHDPRRSQPMIRFVGTRKESER